MERNPNDGNQIPGQSGSANTSSGTGGFGASGGGDYAGATPGTSGSYGGTSGASQSGTGGSFGSAATAEERLQQGKETVKDKFGEGKEAANQKLSKAREKAGELKSTLADKLEQGAEKLRSRGKSGSFAGDTGSGSAPIASDDRMVEVSNRVAGGLQASADWIREADVDSVRTGVETQVKEHPGRTLLIAAGLGYLLGKAFRR